MLEMEITKMQFSVLMSIYIKDNPCFLKLALESIYESQNRKPDEIVIVFDGPLTDDLYNVVDSFIEDKSGIVKVIKLEKNGGLGNALRVGSMACKYEYIFRMDSDDISDSSRFEKQLSYMAVHPELDVVGTDIAEFNQSPNEKLRIRQCPERHDDIVIMGKRRNPMNHVSICMKKTALIKCGGYESLMLLEDYYLWLKMIVAGCKLGNINESLVYVRIGNGFNSKRSSKDRVVGWRVLQNYMVANGLISKTQASINMIYIKTFVGMPNCLKSFVYNKVLRK